LANLQYAGYFDVAGEAAVEGQHTQARVWNWCIKNFYWDYIGLMFIACVACIICVVYVNED